jgi:cobalt/nickel transport system ATP-binding protein
MDGYADRPVHNLSFGQKKRVCIAGVLAMEPELLILDEPMAGLDHAMRTELLSVLDGLHARGITLLMATHDIDLAYRWADHIHVMIAGRCSASLPSHELETRHAALTEAGLPLPTVMTLHRELVARGMLPSHASPRSHAELLSRLAAQGRPHSGQEHLQETPCR